MGVLVYLSDWWLLFTVGFGCMVYLVLLFGLLGVTVFLFGFRLLCVGLFGYCV